MSHHTFTLANETLHALPSGALVAPTHATLIVSDLHLGKSDRIARRTGTLIPPYENTETLQKLATDIAAGRRWLWIEGNHDPGPVDLGGTHLAQTHLGGIALRHIATDATPEVSGHYHPKLALKGLGRARACFVYDQDRLILPAYGAYTGGLSAQHPDLRKLFGAQAIAVLTGHKALPVPLKP